MSRPTPADKREEPQQLDLFELSTGPVCDSQPRSSSAAPTPAQDTVSGLLDQYFTDKVRRRDRDQDGRLSREEFDGPDELFGTLDTNNDGLIGPADLKLQFLSKNPEMRDMAEGFAHTLYDQILNAPSGEPEKLVGMVEEFFDRMVAKKDSDEDGVLGAKEFPGGESEFRRVAPKAGDTISREDLVRAFRQENPDLVELHESLRNLKEMVKPPKPRPRHLDVYS